MESELSASYPKAEADRTQNIASSPHDSGGPDDRPAVELWRNAEGRILLAGVGLAAIFLTWLGFKAVTSPSQSHALLAVTMLTATLGRPTAIEVGYTMSLSTPVLFGIPVTVEMAIVLIFYPLVAISCQRLVAVKALRKPFQRLLETAENYKTSIRRYGPIGLFVFVLTVPYGSPIGAVIGFLLRIPVWLNLATVLSATVVATFFWAVFLHHLHGLVSAYGPYATLTLVAALGAGAVIGHLRQRATRRKGRRS